ncbi:hypothetical protein HHK36_033117 [Tetracentron sinense]|uniref:Retrotransposon Copia-like N-terminal domain-containing protein n=1 Tax=Tetracentron sinense TaxID=13715 RepID=A0A835CYZ7_TETSI|nr:hypothetical protein HHK36_033117 [Tetracentron sinense]
MASSPPSSIVTPTPSSNSAPPPPPPSYPFNVTNINQFVSIKLDGSNYLLWHSQITPILTSQDLFGFVDGSITPPSPQLAENLNPEYHLWRKTDQFILSSLNATLTPSVSTHTIDLSTSKAVWVALETTFAQHSGVQSMHLRGELQSIKKGIFSIADFLLKIKSLADSLAAINLPISDDDLVHHTLHGLSADYEAFITAVSNRVEPITFEELRAWLLQHEQRLAHLHPPSAGSDAQPTALYTNRAPSRGSRFRCRGYRSNGGRNANNNRSVPSDQRLKSPAILPSGELQTVARPRRSSPAPLRPVALSILQKQADQASSYADLFLYFS